METRWIVLCGMFAALTAAGAFIQIPVPFMDYFTLQFLFVLLAGMLLGPRYGSISMGIYVLVGLAGVPVFAAGGGIRICCGQALDISLDLLPGPGSREFFAAGKGGRDSEHICLLLSQGWLLPT